MHFSRKSVVLRFLFLAMLVAGLTLLAQQLPVYAQNFDNVVYLPMSARPTANCDVQGVSYGTLSPTVRTDRPAAEHGDLNLALRGWSRTSANLSLVSYGGDTDVHAPQIDAMFSPDRRPRFSSSYRVNHWHWGCNCRGGPITDWDVTLLGMATTPGEPLSIPDSGYHIGGGYEALVLYATENRLTLKYSAEDNVVQGYTVHLENLCVDPDLLRLYRDLNAAGRGQLPALREGQAFGRAGGSEILIAVRDNGTFLDPRSQKDWWKAYAVR